LNLPSTEDRTLIIGRTGSGKTYAGLWLLSEMPIDEQPWVIIDYKGDKNIARIPFAHPLSLGEIPVLPGVYVVRPHHTQTEEMESFLMAIWEHEGIGIYIDEGAMLSKSDALDTILIQGRSKNVPVIMLTQRPVGISRFAFSESQHFLIFPNHDKREQKTVAEIAPLFQTRDSDDAFLPPYHFHYYHVSERASERMSPVPSLERILKVFYTKLKPEDKLNEPVPVPAMSDLQERRMILL
jgi:hypothetical protein